MGYWDTWNQKMIIRVLKKNGFWEVKHKKHPKWTNGEVVLIIPNTHSGKDIWRDIVKQIIRDSGIPRKKWRK